MKSYCFMVLFHVSVALTNHKVCAADEVPLKKVTLTENETIALLEWKNGQETEITLLRVEIDDCIYRSVIKEDVSSRVLITGCFGEEEITIQVQSEIFGDILATAAVNGTIKPPTKTNASLKHDIYFPSGDDELFLPRSKRSYVLNLDFYKNNPPSPFTIRNSKIHVPDLIEVDVNVYIAPSWRKQFGTNSRSKRIMMQAAEMFQSHTLETKIELKLQEPLDVQYELKPTLKDLRTFQNHLSSKANLKRSMNLLLAWDGNEPDLIGLATHNGMCDDKFYKAATICRHFIDEKNTAQSVAHELGHIIGMFHDFQNPTNLAEEHPQLRGHILRNKICGAPELEGGANNFLMNYDLPMQSKWSECSNEDFRNYYKEVTANYGNFCLKEASTSVPEKPQVVDCVWATWSKFGSCTKTCGGGIQIWQRREKINAKNGGKPCEGDLVKTTDCNLNSCPTPAFLDEDEVCDYYSDEFDYDQCQTLQNKCKTVDGKSCVFPFMFRQKEMTNCISGQRRKQPWCPTEVDSNGEPVPGQWGYCDDQCSTQGTEVDKQFLIMGGDTSGNELATEVIDLNSSSSPFGDIPSKRRYAVGGLLGSSPTPILCGGGWNPYYDSCITFKNSQWTKTHEMTTKRGYAASIQLNSTTLWILGGENDDGTLDSTEFLRADSSVGIQGPNLPIAMDGFCAVKFSEEEVYLIGGWTGTERLNTVYILNPMDSSHIEGPALKSKRSAHTCGLISNGQITKIVVAGGVGNDYLSSVEIFDPTTNNWISGPSLPYKLSSSAMATSPDGGGVILFGGYNWDKRAKEDTLLELRFGADKWTPLPQKLNQPKNAHVVIPIP